jgi:D-threo-aldose 1-dehydrogenase
VAESAAAIPRKVLGKTGVEVTTVGIGTAWIGLATAMGDTVDRTLNEDLALQTIWAALESGVRLIDTAALYLSSQSERIVGRALREQPDLARGVVVETKCCRLPSGSDYSYDGAMSSVQGSLERLGADRIELLYIHDPPRASLGQVLAPDGALAALRKLQSEGVIGHIGVASNYPDDNAPFVETGEFEMAVVPDAYSLLTQTALDRIFPAAQRFGMGIVVATPLERGLLAIGAARARAGNAEFYNRRFGPEVFDHVAGIEAVCQRHGVSLLAAALQFVTRHPVVATTIPGPRTPAEARANALAGAEAIPAAFWDEVQPLIRTLDIMVPR